MTALNLRPRVERIGAALRFFFLHPASPRPLAALRIGLSSVLLVQAFLLRRELQNLYASDGYVQGTLNQYIAHPLMPKIAWILPLAERFNIGEASCISAIGAAYVAALIFLGSGLFTRTASVFAWLLHFSLMNTSTTSNYGADLYGHVFLFYLMLSPAAGAWSIDALLRRVPTEPSSMARWSLRVMQIHLCLAYLASGIEKASGVQWWNGELLWRAFQLPVYQQFDMSWLVNFPILSMVAGWSTLVFELGYCVFIWPRRTRPLWVLAAVGLHLGIAVTLGLGIFGTMMAILTLAIFGFSADGSGGVRRALPAWSHSRRLLKRRFYVPAARRNVPSLSASNWGPRAPDLTSYAATVEATGVSVKIG